MGKYIVLMCAVNENVNFSKSLHKVSILKEKIIYSVYRFMKLVLKIYQKEVSKMIIEHVV